MITRNEWIQRIEQSWLVRPIVWLQGVRRSGKTTLGRMIEDIIYLNCDLPSVQKQFENPEFALWNFPQEGKIMFDEIHRLQDPSLVLKIAADEFPNLRILATGSSSLAASKKFSDSLTGRKTNLFLPSVLWSECLGEFNVTQLDTRLMRGGLPEFLLQSEVKSEYFLEWAESLYARDIIEFYSLRNRSGFLKMLSLMFMHSGGRTEITSLSRDSGLSRPTVMMHMEMLQQLGIVTLVTPFFGGGKKEVLKRPKLYAFDTGFVAFYNNWTDIRDSDRGILWEHLVLDMLRIRFSRVQYWMDREEKEIDFVVKTGRTEVAAYECKINPDKMSVASLRKFRQLYPDGENYCISPYAATPYSLILDGLVIQVRNDIL